MNRTPAWHAETHEQLLAWRPQAEGFVLDGATHFLQLEGPSRSRAMAEALASFLARHPIPIGEP
jgi:pimeloyl-ACP methyl ester carboxylesterase